MSSVTTAGARLRWAHGLAQLFTGIFAGFLLGVLVLEATLRDESAGVYFTVRTVELQALDVLASATLLPAIAAVLAMVILSPGQRWKAPTWALLLLGCVFVLSLTINVPINSDQLDWTTGGLPSDWEEVRDRWLLAHVARTIAAIAAFVLLIVSRPGHHPVAVAPPTRHT